MAAITASRRRESHLPEQLRCSLCSDDALASRFIGPPVNVSAGTAAVSCAVLPPAFATGWAGIGIGDQATTGSTLTAAPNVLAVWPNRSWAVSGRTGIVPPSSSDPWLNLSLTLTEDGRALSFAAHINGAEVASGPVSPDEVLRAPPPGLAGSNHPFAFLAASYSSAAGVTPDDDSTPSTGDASNAEFKDLCLAVTSVTPKHAPSGPPPGPSPSPSPTPTPPGAHGLGLAPCEATDARQLWTFSGEDRGEPGTLSAESNASLCLDALEGGGPPWRLPITPQPCGAVGSAAHAEQLWRWDSSLGRLSSVATVPCKVHSHGVNCSVCLDVERNSRVDLFDCKPHDPNQLWSYEPANGASLMRKGDGETGGSCLALFA